jgi:hypothetical protein
MTLLVDPNLAAVQSAAAAAWEAARQARNEVWATWGSAAASVLVATVAVTITLVQGVNGRRSRRASRKHLVATAIFQATRPFAALEGWQKDAPVNPVLPSFRWSLSAANDALSTAMADAINDPDLIRVAQRVRDNISGLQNACDVEDQEGEPISCDQFKRTYGKWNAGLLDCGRELSAL